MEVSTVFLKFFDQYSREEDERDRTLALALTMNHFRTLYRVKSITFEKFPPRTERQRGAADRQLRSAVSSELGKRWEYTRGKRALR